MRAALIERLRETDIDGANYAYGDVRLRPLGFWPGWMLVELRIIDDHARATDGETVLSVVFGPDGFSPLNVGLRTFRQHTRLHGAVFTAEAECLAYLQLYMIHAFRSGDPGWLLWPGGPVSAQDGDGSPYRPGPTEVDLGAEPPSIYDKVRAPAAAVIEADIHVAGRINRCRFRLDREGAVTILSDQTSCPVATLVPQVRLEGALRTAECPRQEGSA